MHHLVLLLLPASAAIGWYLFRAPKVRADLPPAPPPEPVPDFVMFQPGAMPISGSAPPAHEVLQVVDAAGAMLLVERPSGIRLLVDRSSVLKP